MYKVSIKLYKIMDFITFMPIILIVILGVRILKPIIFVRFGPIRSDVLGASMQVYEYYLSTRDLYTEKYIVFFISDHLLPINNGS